MNNPLKDIAYINIGQFLKSIHAHTERVNIEIVNHTFDKNIPQFLSKDVFKCSKPYTYDYPEVVRLMKYYGEAPVWNIVVDYEMVDRLGQNISGQLITGVIVGHVHFSDIRDAWYREKMDIKKQKQKEYYEKRKVKNSKISHEKED